MAITRIIRELIQVDLVEEGGKRDRDGNPGRRSTDLQIQPSAAYVVGLVISAFGHELTLADATGRSLTHRKLVFDDVRSPEKTIQAASNAITSLIDELGIDKNLILGIGVAIAATVESTTGTVVQSHFLGWHQVKLGSEISRITGYPVIVDSIANALNIAEQSIGKVRGYEDVFLVHNSTACGASFTHKGNLLRGANNSVGQIGHLYAGKGSLICSCGASGCLDTHASGWAVLVGLGLLQSKYYQPADVEMHARALSKLISEESPRGSEEYEAIFKAGWHMGQALRNIVLIVDPQAIVLTGELPKSPAFEAGCREAWEQSPLVLPGHEPKIFTGSVLPLQSAAFLALDYFLYSPRFNIERMLAVAGQSGAQNREQHTSRNG